MMNQLNELFERPLPSYPRDDGVWERYMVNLDPDGEIFRRLGCTYGRRMQHKDVLIDVGGCASQGVADNMVAIEVARRGWQWRERWWQFWRPRDFRTQP